MIYVGISKIRVDDILVVLLAIQVNFVDHVFLKCLGKYWGCDVRLDMVLVVYWIIYELRAWPVTRL